MIARTSLEMRLIEISEELKDMHRTMRTIEGLLYRIAGTTDLDKRADQIARVVLSEMSGLSLDADRTAHAKKIIFGEVSVNDSDTNGNCTR